MAHEWRRPVAGIAFTAPFARKTAAARSGAAGYAHLSATSFYLRASRGARHPKIVMAATHKHHGGSGDGRWRSGENSNTLRLRYRAQLYALLSYVTSNRDAAIQASIHLAWWATKLLSGRSGNARASWRTLRISWVGNHLPSAWNQEISRNSNIAGVVWHCGDAGGGVGMTRHADVAKRGGVAVAWCADGLLREIMATPR